MCGKVLLYSRGVGVCAWCDGTRRCRLQHLRGTHHHVKLTWILRKIKETTCFSVGGSKDGRNNDLSVIFNSAFTLCITFPSDDEGAKPLLSHLLPV